MKRLALKLCKLFLGYFIIAFGIVMTINANLGLAPWDVFHQGISNVFGITIGKSCIIVGAVIVALDFILGERVGWATILNMIFVGVFMDILMINNVVPQFHNIISRSLMMILGMFVEGFGIYLYISVELGSGPRDGLMIALVKRTGKSVRLIKAVQDITAVTLGYILDGHAGVGTFVMAVFAGYFIQLAFKIIKFDVSKVQHRFIDEDIKYIKNKIKYRALNNNGK